jgi:hypothetical protein
MRKNPPIIKGGQAEPAQSSVLTGPKALVGAKDGTTSSRGRAIPEIALRKQGDLIEAIEITCPCGNHMVIECLYDPTTAEVTP